MNIYDDFYQYWALDNQSMYNQNMHNQNFMETTNDPYDNFIIGNGFPETFKGYKNYKPAELNPANEREYLMLMVQIYDFAAHELTLYLDTHPEDRNAINKRQEMSRLAKEALDNYEMKYGAINLASDTLGATPWQWDKNNFPWEVM